MKRKFIFAIVFIFIMLPFAAFTKTVISDKELDDVTAEEGVSLDLNSQTIQATVGTTSWGDGDGYGTYSSVGFMGTTETTISGSFDTVGNETIKIDVGTSSPVTAVVIGIPATTLAGMNVTTIMKVSPNMNLSGGGELGRLNQQGFSTMVSADAVRIFAH